MLRSSWSVGCGRTIFGGLRVNMGGARSTHPTRGDTRAASASPAAASSEHAPDRAAYACVGPIPADIPNGLSAASVQLSGRSFGGAVDNSQIGIIVPRRATAQ